MMQRDGPLNQLVGGFRPTSSTAQAQLLRVQRGVQMATKILEAVETKVIAFQQKLKVLNTDMDSLRDIINNHRDIVQVMGEDVVIDPDDSRVLVALSGILNQEDIDHTL
ncbi:hypothetical protein AC1031_012493 [Aphanomyces cochlioides]|nr:hypothetical protein AC1031_012493 [Aphanomyces cochlioides]